MTRADDLRKREPETGKAPYWRFLVLAVGIVAALIALGHVPTQRLAGEDGLAAMVAGCGISVLAALFGTVPVMLARGLAASQTVPAIMLSIVFRLVAVLILGVAAAVSGWFEPTPLFIWLILSHAFLQIAEIRLAKQVLYTNRVSPEAGLSSDPATRS